MTHYIDNINVEAVATLTAYAPRLTITPTTTNGTLTLTAESTFLQELTGSASGYSLVLPNATTLTEGWKYEIWNSSTLPITLKYSDGTTANPIPTTSFVSCTLEDNSTAKGSWLFFRAFTGTASGIINYTISSATTYTLSSGTAYATITGMSVTPVSGTYAAWYSGSLSISANNTTVSTAIFIGGSVWTDSIRDVKSSVSTFVTIHSTMAIIAVNGSQTVDVRISRNNGSATVTGRSLILIRIGD
jgi:hypothetical protein